MTALVLAITLLGCVALARSVNGKIAARRMTERRKKARLLRHAEEEHQLLLEGNPAGIYGAYAPAPELRGVGIRMGG